MVRVLYGVDAGVSPPLVMPTDAELRTLAKIAYAKYPQLDPHADARTRVVVKRYQVKDPNDPKNTISVSQRELQKDGDFDQPSHDSAFRHVFWAVGQLGRLPEPESRNVRSLLWWTGYLKDLLLDHRFDLDVDPRSFAAACLAHGDVPHTIAERWPYDVSFGLTLQHAGTPARDAWRNVLKTGALLPATRVYSPEYQPGRVNIDLAPGALGLVGSTFR